MMQCEQKNINYVKIEKSEASQKQAQGLCIAVQVMSSCVRLCQVLSLFVMYYQVVSCCVKLRQVLLKGAVRSQKEPKEAERSKK